MKLTNLRNLSFVGATFLYATLGLAQDPGSTSPTAGIDAGADRGGDAAILAELHGVNQLEIQAGKIAAQKGSADVKAFGRHLVSDHTAADKKVMALAKKEKIDLVEPTKTDAKLEAMSKDSTQTLSDLRAVSSKEFDGKFIAAMVKGHQETIDDVKAAQDKTNDPEIKKLLSGLLPELQKHHEKATSLSEKITSG